MSLTTPEQAADRAPSTTRPRPLPITVGERPDAQWPAAETSSTRRAVHVIAIAALTFVTAYLLWRVAATLSPLSLVLGVALLLLEAWSLITVAMQAVVLWNVDAVRPPREVTATDATVTVLIPTDGESHQVLMPTLAAATRMRLATEIIVLDNGHRPWLAGMCDELGVEYRTRIHGDGSLAAQVNSVLPTLASDYLVILAPDQVANRDLIGRTLGHFDDPKVALVQTPLDFYNEGSYEHVTRGRQRFAEQNLFERVLGAGRNHLDAAVWNGGAAVVRRSALAAVGGVAVGTQAEGIDTSLALHRQGWRTILHNEVLARGLGASDAAEYGRRRATSAAGAMQILRGRNVLFGRGLTGGQRLSYTSLLTDWLGGWRALGYLVVPAVALLLAMTPATGPVAAFALLFPLTFVARQVARRTLGRGEAPHGDLTVFGIIRMAATLRATGALLTGRPAVLPAPDRDARRVPPLLWVLVAVNASALAWGAAVALGLLSVTYPYAVVAWGAAAWTLGNLVYLGRAVARIRSKHFGGDRRGAHRIDVEGHVFLDGNRVHVLDLSLTGVRALSYGELPEPGSYCAVTFTDPNRRPAVVTGTIAGIRPRPHGHEVRIELEPDQTYVMGAILAEALIRPVA